VRALGQTGQHQEGQFLARTNENVIRKAATRPEAGLSMTVSWPANVACRLVITSGFDIASLAIMREHAPVVFDASIPSVAGRAGTSFGGQREFRAGAGACAIAAGVGAFSWRRIRTGDAK